jgi:uncharacterized membrane protein
MQTNNGTRLIETQKLKTAAIITLGGVLMLGSALCAQSRAPAADNYVIRTIDAPVADKDVQYNFINNSGLIVQQYLSPAGGPFPDSLHVAVLQDGQWTEIKVPGVAWTGPGGLNDSGQIIVGGFTPDGELIGMIWKRGRMTDLPQIPGFVFLSNGFNNKGQMAGNAYFPDGTVHGFVGNSRQYGIFDYPAPDTFTIPSKINDAGVLVGTYDVAPEPFGVQVHAFMKVGAQLTNLDLPGTDGTSALSINNPGTIVGYYVTGEVRHGYIRDRDSWVSFDVPGAVMSWVTDINDHGVLVGGYQDAQGQTHGFEATHR